MSSTLILKQRIEELKKTISCPVSMEIMKDPQRLPCDHTFEKTTIMNLQKYKYHCPVCRKPFTTFHNNFESCV